MVTAVQSFTSENVAYDVTINRSGVVTHCGCPARHFNASKPCKHMVKKQVEVNAEIERAARFLAVCREVQGLEETWKANREMAWDNRF